VEGKAMTLTTEQLHAIEAGEAIELTIDGTRCIIVRQDIYDRAQQVVDPSPRETYPAVLKALEKFDESPEQYLEYLND
jgi:hypothetical protein